MTGEISDVLILDVTAYMTDHDCSLYSSSIAESGLQNIGRITWENALRHVAVEGLVSPDQVSEVREWLVSTGGWSRDELAEFFDDQGINALLLQFIASEIRDYERALEHGREPELHNLYQGDDQRWYYTIG
jgi:hypothetical protein